MNTQLSIVIPCYNESGNIPLITGRLREILADREDVEVVLVNNGSTDDSTQVFQRELAENPGPFVVEEVKVNQGYGYGILAGLQKAKGQSLAWTHADMQTDPKDVLVAYQMYQEANDPMVFIKGKRKKRALLEAFFTWGMQCLASLILGTRLDDVNAQPKLFSRKFYEAYIKDQAPNDFSLDLFALYQAKRQASQIKELPVYFNKRIHGEAKGGGSWKTRIMLIKRTFAYIFELNRKLRQA